jgi:hypothetical protein
MVKTAYIGVIFVSMLISQEFVVQPYLQNATPIYAVLTMIQATQKILFDQGIFCNSL